MFHVGVLYRVGWLLEFLDGRTLSEDVFLHNFGSWKGISGKYALEVAYQGGWINKSVGNLLEITSNGRDIINNKEPSDRLRDQIQSLIVALHPEWTRLAKRGRKALEAYAPAEVIQCLREAELLDRNEWEIVTWWDKLVSIAFSDQNSQRLETGRKGEWYSVQFEARRTSVQPEWVALNRTEAGYDVLSRIDAGNGDSLLIEVKSSKSSWKQAFITLSSNEWRILSSASNACLHLWCLKNDPPNYAIIPVSSVLPHIPVNCAEGKWECVRIPFKALSASPAQYNFPLLNQVSYA